MTPIDHTINHQIRLMEIQMSSSYRQLVCLVIVAAASGCKQSMYIVKTLKTQVVLFDPK